MEAELIDNSRRVVADVLQEVFAEGAEARVAVAFARGTGVTEAPALRRVVESGRTLKFLAGVDFQQTELDALTPFQKAPAAEARVYMQPPAVQRYVGFHPKLYLGLRGDEVRALVGSSNFTAGGLRANVEANLLVRGRRDEVPIAQLLDFHSHLWNSPFTVPITDGVRKAYALLQERRHDIELRLRQQPDYRTAVQRTDLAVAEAVAAATIPKARGAWLLVTSPGNYDLCRREGLWGDEHKSKISQIEPGDILVFYRSKEYQLGLVGVVTSTVFEDRTPLWPDRPYPYRLRFTPIVEPVHFLPFKPLVPTLDLFKRTDPKHFGQVLQTSQVSLSTADAQRLCQVIFRASEHEILRGR
jgi:HKD family nuclease/predicted RNA-binding protein